MKSVRKHYANPDSHAFRLVMYVKLLYSNFLSPLPLPLTHHFTPHTGAFWNRWGSDRYDNPDSNAFSKYISQITEILIESNFSWPSKNIYKQHEKVYKTIPTGFKNNWKQAKVVIVLFILNLSFTRCLSHSITMFFF